MPPESGSIDAPKVQIHYLDPKAVTDKTLLARMASWLDETERNRLGRFLSPTHRHAFLVSHALLRKVLANTLGCPPREICFALTGRGKPVLSLPKVSTPLHFNLTHTHGMAVVAIGTAPLGVDAEWLGRFSDGYELARRYFTAHEVDDIRNQPIDLQQQRFLTYWTLKEAFLKAQGWGIVDSLHGFEFELSSNEPIRPQRIRLRIQDASLTPTHPWRFHHWQIGHEHLVSLAVSARLETGRIAPQPWMQAHWDY